MCELRAWQLHELPWLCSLGSLGRLECDLANIFEQSHTKCMMGLSDGNGFVTQHLMSDVRYMCVEKPMTRNLSLLANIVTAHDVM